MKMASLASALLVFVITLPGCSSDTGQSSQDSEFELATLSGTVHFESEAPLVAGRTLSVKLVDVTEGEANAPVLASSQIGEGSTSPHAFSLAYDPGIIREDRQYLVYAELLGGTGPVQRSLASIDPFAGEDLTLAFARSKPRPTGQSAGPVRTISLQGFKWYLDVLGDEQIGLDLEARPYIEIDRQEDSFRGSGGCNSYSGTYELDGTSLGLGPAAVTRKACETGMDLEDRFLAMLGEVGSWRLEDGQMVLGTEQREELARFILDSSQ